MVIFVFMISKIYSSDRESKALERTISDMETDGVYFPPQIKDELKKRLEELHCEYSGLPSVMSYMEEENDASSI